MDITVGVSAQTKAAASPLTIIVFFTATYLFIKKTPKKSEFYLRMFLMKKAEKLLLH